MKLLKFIPAILWALLILFLCSIPGRDLPAAGWMDLVSFDKWAHFALFAVQMGLLLHAIRKQYSAYPRRFDERWYWFGAVIIYGGLTEGYQHWFLEDRTADIYDFVANTAGALAGWWIYERYLSVRFRRNDYEKTL